MTTLSFPDAHRINAPEWQQFLDFLTPLYVRKTSQETRSADTSPSQDDDLFVYVQPNATYRVRGLIFYNGGTSEDFRLGWEYPTDAAMHWNPQGSIDSMAGVTADRWFGHASIGTVVGPGTAGTGSPVHCRPHGHLITGATGGRFGVLWAQWVSGGTTTTVMPGSFLILNRIS